MSDKGRLVYSSDDEGDADLRKAAKAKAVTRSLPPGEQTAQIRREKQGRGGKVVTTVRGLTLTPADLTALAKQIKRACGSGGTVKDGVIEIQGDHRDTIAAALQKAGYRTKFTGG